MDNNEWQENTGVQPVAPSVLVDVIWRNGSQFDSKPANFWCWDLEQNSDRQSHCDIIKWRLHESKE